jgi:hypothetical protein
MDNSADQPTVTGQLLQEMGRFGLEVGAAVGTAFADASAATAGALYTLAFPPEARAVYDSLAPAARAQLDASVSAFLQQSLVMSPANTPLTSPSRLPIGLPSMNHAASSSSAAAGGSAAAGAPAAAARTHAPSPATPTREAQRADETSSMRTAHASPDGTYAVDSALEKTLFSDAASPPAPAQALGPVQAPGRVDHPPSNTPERVHAHQVLVQPPVAAGEYAGPFAPAPLVAVTSSHPAAPRGLSDHPPPSGALAPSPVPPFQSPPATLAGLWQPAVQAPHNPQRYAPAAAGAGLPPTPGSPFPASGGNTTVIGTVRTPSDAPLPVTLDTTADGRGFRCPHHRTIYETMRPHAPGTVSTRLGAAATRDAYAAVTRVVSPSERPSTLTSFHPLEVFEFWEALRRTRHGFPEDMIAVHEHISTTLEGEVTLKATELFPERAGARIDQFSWRELADVIYALALPSTMGLGEFFSLAASYKSPSTERPLPALSWKRGPTARDTFTNLSELYSSLQALLQMLPTDAEETSTDYMGLFLTNNVEKALAESIRREYNQSRDEMWIAHKRETRYPTNSASLPRGRTALQAECTWFCSFRHPQKCPPSILDDTKSGWASPKSAPAAAPASASATSQQPSAAAGAGPSAAGAGKDSAQPSKGGGRGKSRPKSDKAPAAPPKAAAAVAAAAPQAGQKCATCNNNHPTQNCMQKGGAKETKCNYCSRVKKVATYGHDEASCRNKQRDIERGAKVNRIAAPVRTEALTAAAPSSSAIPAKLSPLGERGKPIRVPALVGGTATTVRLDSLADINVMDSKTCDALAAHCDRLRLPYEISTIKHPKPVSGRYGEMEHVTRTAKFLVAYRIQSNSAGDAPSVLSFESEVLFHIDNPNDAGVGEIIIGAPEIDLHPPPAGTRKLETPSLRVFKSLVLNEGLPVPFDTPATQAPLSPAPSAEALPHKSIRQFTEPESPLGGNGAAEFVEVVVERPQVDGNEDDGFAAGTPLDFGLDSPDNLTPTEAEIKALALRSEAFAGKQRSLALLADLLAHQGLQGPDVDTPTLPTFSIEQKDEKLRILEGARQQLSARVRDAATKTIDRLLERGILVRCSLEELTHVHRVVVVMKSDGTARITMDLRSLNANTVVKPTVLPKVKTFPSLYTGCYAFSKIDLRDCFFQFPVDDKTSYCLGIRLPDGTYARLVRAPQGHSNVPGFVQHWLITHVLVPFQAKSSGMTVIEGMLDDVILGTRSTSGTKPAPGSAEEAAMLDTHLADLRIFLDLLAQHNVRIAACYRKCEFLVPKVTALGYVFDGLTTRVDPARIQDLADMKIPERIDVDFLRRAIGLFNYHREAVRTFRFLTCLDLLNKVLTRALNAKVKVPSSGPPSGRPPDAADRPARTLRALWTKEHTAAFYYLRDSIITAIEQYTPDLSKVFHVYTDASKTGWGAYVTQFHDGVEHPVMVLGKAFTATQIDMKTGQKEAYSAVAFVRSLGLQLLQWNWILHTDHENLLDMQHSEDPLTRRWFLEIYHVCDKIQHIAGAVNVVADALSRHPFPPPVDAPLLSMPVEAASVNRVSLGPPTSEPTSPSAAASSAAAPGASPSIPGALTVSDVPLLKRIAEAQRAHRAYFVAEPTKFKPVPTVGSGERHDIYHCGTQIAVPPGAADLVTHIVSLAHDSCHRGERETADRLGGFWFENKKAIVGAYVASCALCQHGKSPDTRAPTGTSSPLVYSSPLACVIADYQGPLPATADGAEYILTFTDAHSRFTWAFVVPKADSLTSAQTLEKFCLSLDVPAVVQTDMGSHFQGVFPDACKRLGITHHITHSQHPQSNGVGERVHRNIIESLRTLLTPATADADWDKKVARAVHTHNTSVNRSTRFTPIALMIGRKRRDALTASLDAPVPEERPETRESSLAALRELATASSASAAMLGAAARDAVARPVPPYKPGDTVLVHHLQRPGKLHSHFRGPAYTIVSADPVNPNFFIVGQREPDGTISSQQSVAADRLLPFDSSRTTPAEEEIRIMGPDYHQVDGIASHQPRPDYPGEFDFYVDWHNSPPSPGTLEDLHRLPVFLAYCKQHRISSSQIKRQLRQERARRKGPPAQADASSAAAVLPSDTEPPPALTIPLARKPREALVTEYERNAVLDEAVVAKALYKPGDHVVFNTYKGVIKGVISTRGGKPWYNIAFPGRAPNKADHTGYVEGPLLTLDTPTLGRATRTSTLDQRRAEPAAAQGQHRRKKGNN